MPSQFWVAKEFFCNLGNRPNLIGVTSGPSLYMDLSRLLGIKPMGQAPIIVISTVGA